MRPRLENLFVPCASVMVGLGLCERVYGLARPSAVHEVVSSNPPLTAWDLRRNGWREASGLWTKGPEAMVVHTRPRPLPSVSALRWAYDGRELTCLDPAGAGAIVVDPAELRYLETCLRAEDGWLYADPAWLGAIVRLAEALPPGPGLDMDRVLCLYEKIKGVI